MREGGGGKRRKQGMKEKGLKRNTGMAIHLIYRNTLGQTERGKEGGRDKVKDTAVLQRTTPLPLLLWPAEHPHDGRGPCIAYHTPMYNSRRTMS